MRKLLILLMIIPLFVHSQSPRKLIDEGKYDLAIDELVQSLEKNSKNRKKIALLEEAFNKADRKDNDSIMQLKASGMPDIWGRVYQLYLKRDLRQARVKKLPANVVQGLNVEWENYSPDMDAAKGKAAAYCYANAERLLGMEGRENARKAFNSLYEITRLYESYRDVEKLMIHSIVKDCGTLPVKVINRTGNELPEFLPKEIVAFSLSSIEKAYLDITLKPLKGWNYEYNITIYIDRILISPDKTEKSKETIYNSIRIPLVADTSRFEEVSCEIFEINQHKACEIISMLSFTDYRTGRAIYQKPVRAKTAFEHSSYFLQGDQRACPPALLEKVKAGDKPFPTDEQMVKGSTRKLAWMVKEIIWDEDYVFD
jgi:hypothetical protein